MCWVALDRGAKIAQMLNKYNYSERWQLEAEKIKKDVMKYGWNKNFKVSHKRPTTKQWILHYY